VRHNDYDGNDAWEAERKTLLRRRLDFPLSGGIGTVSFAGLVGSTGLANRQFKLNGNGGNGLRTEEERKGLR
jgi:hypothetical protein